MKDQQKARVNWKEVFLVVAVLLAVFLVWYGGWLWIDKNVPDAGTGSDTSLISAIRGQFGDKFGAVNALFSGLAFAGIILTIYFQRKDLVATHASMRSERFDNTFFQLLRLQSEIALRVSIKGKTGKEAFEALNLATKQIDPDFAVFQALQKISRERVRQIIDARSVMPEHFPELEPSDIANLREALSTGVRSLENYLDPDPNMHKAKIRAAYERVCLEHLDDFAHYFRTVYHTLRYLDESNLIEDEDRKTYSRFLRAQLSDDELVAIFYNSICEISLPGREETELGCPKMGRLLIRFDVLQHLNPRSLLHPRHKEIFLSSNGPGAA